MSWTPFRPLVDDLTSAGSSDEIRSLILGVTLSVFITIMGGGLLGCEREVTYQDYPFSFDLNVCLSDRMSCTETLAQHTQRGCYLLQSIHSAPDRSSVKKYPFTYEDGRPLFREGTLLSIMPGEVIEGAMYFFRDEMNCDLVELGSLCDGSCLLRLSHVPYTFRQSDNVIRFDEGGECTLESVDPVIRSACILEGSDMIQTMDQGGIEADMGGSDQGHDMGGVDMGDMGDMDVDQGGSEDPCPEDLIGQPCETFAFGPCRDGVYVCEDLGIICRSLLSPSPEVCDGIDNDCDGEVDNQLEEMGVPCLNGVGACSQSGQIVCQEGELLCDAVPLSPALTDEFCDEIDEDCDGLIDEDFQSEPFTCGVGVCVTEGIEICAQGLVNRVCDPISADPLELDRSCDTLDNDCDGVADEGFIGANTQCGLGLCATQGRTECIEGLVSDNCRAPAPTQLDNNCDQVDNDCDGRADEGFQGEVVSCGRGVCVNQGVEVCVNGLVSPSCQPLNAPPGDTDQGCDLIDSDCDGSSDEGYTPRPFTCGDGACEAQGVTDCVLGEEIDRCTPNPPLSPQDATCDGVDDDCDREIDDDYVGSVEFCGLGACRTSVTSRCVGGEEEFDECIPSSLVSSSDNTCDGVDDDCDGLTDEGFVASTRQCDLGDGCLLSSPTSCEDGQERDLCTQFSTRDSDDDGRSDHCNWVTPPGLAFQIQRHEVTVSAYQDCVDAGVCSSVDYAPLKLSASFADHSCVPLEDASPTPPNLQGDQAPKRCILHAEIQQYCRWLDTNGGVDLPSEDQLQEAKVAYALGSCEDSNADCQNPDIQDPHPICALEPLNARLPICDLTGNVLEWSNTRFNDERFNMCLGSYRHSESLLSTCLLGLETYRYPWAGGRCAR